ncbi:hypothetical protein TMatcc_005950 [Talaromyces marneffei ATCC 18224]|uniref:Vacuolar membrane protein n=3 Tax=Talaromyces marneffei TaxID=37727 RepID=B6Q8L0_TALMQ|nr:uncharacterized protein EYB26_005555 [Talaromyces marneffei]EEA25814.1 conserved hypothetical protein [Talaromyces marneffei ATCC 18224]KAE8554511.1 hypothetical protein EYB25_003050 [Talaromyces marneffei]QGA17879.1 hypothetical protein EYB26_005555 [Talaromyces marneffei]
MNLFRNRMASQPYSLLLGLLATFLLLSRVHGASDTGLPRLSTATDTSTTTTATGTTTATTSTGTGLPPLTSTSSSLTDIPTATVPPTSNAPYMQQSSLPEGTVFIAVGAGLGFIGLSVLIWRAMVAWSINRSVRKAAYQQTKSNMKAAAVLRRSSRRKSHRRSGTSGRRRSRRETRGTSMNMEKLSSRSDRQSHVSTKTPATQSSLFFSPTAGAGSHQSLNRTSTFLPAGYYAAGNTAMGSHSQVNLGRSPPGTPSSPPTHVLDVPLNRTSHHLGASTSSLNLNAPPQGRVPSAYLEDLFDNHPPTRPSGQ